MREQGAGIVSQGTCPRDSKENDMTYEEFLRTKEMRAEACGFDVDRESITPMAFDYQRDIIAWACNKGKCAILTGCGT